MTQPESRMQSHSKTYRRHWSHSMGRQATWAGKPARSSFAEAEEAVIITVGCLCCCCRGVCGGDGDTAGRIGGRSPAAVGLFTSTTADLRCCRRCAAADAAAAAAAAIEAIKLRHHINVESASISYKSCADGLTYRNTPRARLYWW